MANITIPFYRNTIDAIESVLGYENIDRAVLRQIRSKFDSRYKAKGMNYYQVERNAVEAFQHGMFGSWTGKNIKEQSGNIQLID